MFKLPVLILLALLAFNSSAQRPYPENYFRSPLDIPISLSGNFAELRSNHFHGGLDIRTESVEGKSVYAIADGYVSRIKIASAGYGKIIYITHPNGYVSTYAHLRNFHDSIARYVRKAQYLNETFEIELFPDSSSLRVKKGDIIAFSGNTGSSAGPHLHFEIRDAITENTINPQLCGFDLEDNIKPKLYGITLYPLDEKSSVNRKNSKRRYPVIGSNGSYKIGEIPEVNGKIGFGVEALDFMNGTGNTFGVFSMEVIIDSMSIYYHEMDEISYDDTRCLNSLIDYPEFKKSGRKIMEGFVEPNNSLCIYKNLVNQGAFQFLDNNLHEVEILVKDIKGNATSAKFKVKGSSFLNLSPVTQISSKYTKLFNYSKENLFETEDFKVNIPPFTLYDDLKMEYSKKDTGNYGFSPAHVIYNDLVPVHSYFTVSIKPKIMTEEQKKKALIICIETGGKRVALESRWRGDFLSGKCRAFGSYRIVTDTIPPSITPINISNGKNLSKASQIRFKISDNLSGIKSYKGYIDDKWVLMEYDAKYASLVYNIEKELSSGSHQFRLEVIDVKGNRREFTAKFSR